MSGDDPRQTAAECFRRGYELQSQGDYERALEFYSRSIVAYPTPEAYTFRGWTYSFLGDYNRAMSECFEAIKLDPEFGNPYNDIGAYLIEQGKWDEAIPWFEKAIEAKRYDARLPALQPGPRLRTQERLAEGQVLLFESLRNGPALHHGAGGSSKDAGVV